MASSSEQRPLRSALDPLVDSSQTATSSGVRAKFDILSKTLVSPFGAGRPDAHKILADLAPVIMTPRMINAAASYRPPRAAITASARPGALSSITRRMTQKLANDRVADSILQLDVPVYEMDGPSLFRAYEATNPAAGKTRLRRREIRASAVDTDRGSRKRLSSMSLGGKAKSLPQEELTRQTNEIMRDKENVGVRRTVLRNEIETLQVKIAKLEVARRRLEEELLKLTEDELELDDELDSVLSSLSTVASPTRPATNRLSSYSGSQRRRKGPAFLPSEHDSLPHGVAFMTLTHQQPILALDFSAPYEVLVSSSADRADYALHIWDLSNGTETRRLSGHRGPVKAIQVEDNICVTGSDDGNVRIWDLNRVSEWEEISLSGGTTTAGSEDHDALEEMTDEFGQMGWKEVNQRRESDKSRAHSRSSHSGEGDQACLRVLDGHSRGVTALYFENDCLVTGASDKTLRQWDLTTGQCIMTMDILWAINNSVQPTVSPPSRRRSSVRPSRYQMEVVAEPLAYAPGYEDYDTFVGGVQFWGYALISGSADGGVRMWDMRTGQAHRTLLGHTAPITCLQFDESHVVTGSLDKTIRIWDLRTGSTMESILFEHGVMDLQFDSRKVVACSSENGINVYNRTTQQSSVLSLAGHTAPATKVRYIDRYMVSGGLDATVKVWAL